MTATHQSTSTIGSESSNAMNGGSSKARGGKGQRRAKGKRAGGNTRTALEALTNAVTQQSTMNYQGIFDGFEAMGIAGDDIKPRENVFTFRAWKALGRVVRKGEHGVRVCVFVPRENRDTETGEITQTRMPTQTTVFHISQTDALPAPDAACAASTTPTESAAA